MDQNDNNNSDNTSNTISESNKKKENPNTSYQIDTNKYKNFIEDVRNKNLNTTEMLIASVNNSIHPEDSIIYSPKSINLMPTKYPIYPLRLTENLVHKFSDNTLFFIFFFQQSPEANIIVFNELSKRGWMFHNDYKTFFKLQGQPKEQNEEYIEGKFKFVDYDHGLNVVDRKRDFKFYLKFLLMKNNII
jgi:CCR4-NOT transcriptional regulation complex NOT5 subunit